MNISKQNIDDLTATLTLTVEKADYADKVENVLKDYRKKAQIPGFRQGNAPMGMIRKQFGMSIQMDEINKLVSNELQKYLNEADFKILGEPLPSDQQETIDFDTQENFDFVFEIGVSPEINIDLSKKDTITAYEIKADDNVVEERIAQFRSQLAQPINPEVALDNDMVALNIVEVEGELTNERAVLMPERLEEEAKVLFVGAKVGDEITFNPFKAMGEAEAARFQGVSADAVSQADFKAIVVEITRYEDAELNEELFARVFPGEEIANEEAFRARIAEEAKKGMEADSNYRFDVDARNYVIEKLKDVALPETFITRWLTLSNQDREDFTLEALEAEMPQILNDLRWQLATSEIAKKAELKVEANDPMDTAKKMAAQQFAMYGLGNVPEEYLEDYAKKMLEDKNQIEGIISQVMMTKVIAHIRENVTVKTKKISMEDFRKLYEK